MASPAIVTTNTTNGVTPTTTPICNLPASLVADRLLLLWLSVATKDAATITLPANWNTILDDTQVTATNRTVLAWKKATGSEGATVTATNGSTSSRFAALSWQISGAADPLVQIPEFATVVIGSSTSMNAGAVTPTGGNKDYLFIVMTANNSASSATPPTNYGGRITATDSTAVQVHACSRQLTAASDDPAGWTTSPSSPWMATTVAVHPPSASAAPRRRMWGGEFFRSSS